jgi:hypothetical protein
MFWRTLYGILGYEYIGKKEQNEIERQSHLKQMSCNQIKNSNIKLNKIYPIPFLSTFQLKKGKKKNKK